MEKFTDKLKFKTGIWRAIDISLDSSAIREFGILKLIWGTDIWISGVSILKCIITANILVWVGLFIFAK